MVSYGEQECSHPRPSAPFEIWILLSNNNKKKTGFPLMVSPNPSTMVLNELDPQRANLPAFVLKHWGSSGTFVFGRWDRCVSLTYGCGFPCAPGPASAEPSVLLGLIITSMGFYYHTDNLFFFYTCLQVCSPFYDVIHFLRKRIYTRHLARSRAAVSAPLALQNVQVEQVRKFRLFFSCLSWTHLIPFQACNKGHLAIHKSV